MYRQISGCDHRPFPALTFAYDLPPTREGASLLLAFQAGSPTLIPVDHSRESDSKPARRAAFPTGDVDVWYRLTGALGEREVDEAVGKLSADERARYMKFVMARDRRDYAAAHALLHESLSRYADVSQIDWRISDRAKPTLAAKDASPPLSFNISHTHGLVACAISDGRDVGVDVEALDRVVDEGIAERFFSASEVADLRRCGSHERAGRFFELWTLKEAYIKAIGEGLSHGLDTFAFDLSGDGSLAFSAPAGVDGSAWRFALYAPTAGYRLAIAARCGTASSLHIKVTADHGSGLPLSPIRTSR